MKLKCFEYSKSIKSLKKIILGWSEAWSTIHLSNCPSDQVYYIRDWQISGCLFTGPGFQPRFAVLLSNKKTQKQTNKPHWRCWAEADTVHRVSPLPLKYQICGMCTWSSAGTRKWAGPAGPLGLAPRTQSLPDQTSKRLHQRTDPSETFDLKKERTTMSVWNLLDLEYMNNFWENHLG